jgi:hypothetical protein
MKYINHFSKQGFVNLFADFIIQNINPSYKTRIQVIDFKSFMVVNGSTSSTELIDLNKLRDEFVEKHQSLINYLKFKNINIIDLIEYKEPIIQQELFFEYYNSSRPIYHPKLINEITSKDKSYNFEFLNSVDYDSKLSIEFYSPFMSEKSHIFSTTNFLSTCSTYPHGYSLNVTRTEFYYGEYLCNHLFDLLQTDKIIFEYSGNINYTDESNINLKCDSMYDDIDIQSLVLDTFDFNFEKFKSDYLLDYNLDLDTTNPLGEKPWLVKNKIKDMILM